MRIDEFNNLPPKNIIGEGTRGPENEFNTHLKKERRPDPLEFSGSEVEEFISYSETMDLRARQSRQSAEQRAQRSEERNLSASRSASRAAQDLTKRFVQQVVCLAAGAVIITNAYQIMVEARNEERDSLSNPSDAVVEIAGPTGTETEATPGAENDTPVENGDENESVESAGNDGESDGGSDSSGNGSSTSGSSGDSGGGGGGQSPAVHTFGTPTQEELGDGSIKLTYTCTECGETYVVIVTVDPEQ